nr:MAG TPA: hypothetical protein [Caudoviricetes sp.]
MYSIFIFLLLIREGSYNGYTSFTLYISSRFECRLYIYSPLIK